MPASRLQVLLVSRPERCVTRIQLEGAAKLRKRLRDAAMFGEREGQCRMRRRVAVAERDRTPILCDRVVGALQRHERRREVLMRPGIGGSGLGSQLKLGQRLGSEPLSHQRKRKISVRHPIAGPERERAAILLRRRRELIRVEEHIGQPGMGVGIVRDDPQRRAELRLGFGQAALPTQQAAEQLVGARDVDGVVAKTDVLTIVVLGFIELPIGLRLEPEGVVRFGTPVERRFETRRSPGPGGPHP